MAIFAIVLLEPNEVVRSRIEDSFPNPNHFLLGDRFWVVTGTGVSEHIATRVGLKGPDRAPDVSGVVFRLQRGYSGYTNPGLWEWLTDHTEDF